MVNKIYLLLLSAILLVAVNSKAQTGQVRGFVYDKENGEPIIFTNVIITELKLGKATDINGFYEITKLKEGSYTLKCISIGYDTAAVLVNVLAGKSTTQNLYLVKKTVKLDEASVSADRNKQKNEVKISVTTITQKDLKNLPSFGGEPDLAQFLQVLPGVVFSGDQGGQLYIRGGTPVHNKVLLDGMTIYNPFHSIGLFSVFDGDIIRSADVYAGGFGAQYGGRIGAIVDVNTREGNKVQLAGKASVSTVAAKILLEGPIKKFKDGASSSYLLSYKTSYIDKTAPILYPYAGNDGLPFSFNDLYGKLSFIGASGAKLNLFGFNFTDQVNYPATQYKWGSYGLGANFFIIPEGTTLVNGNISYSKYSMSQIESDNLPRESDIGGFNIGLNFTNYIGKDDVKYGVELNGFSTNYQYVNSYGRLLQQEEFTTELSGYVRYKKSIDRLIIEPGLRIQAYASLGEVAFEPRLATKYNITDKIRVKAAGGYYTQNLMSASSDQDVVNLFYGFLSGPQDLPKTFDGKEVTSALQKAWHLGGGFEFDIGQHQEINIEGFYKWFTQLTNVNRDKIYEQDQLDKPEFQRLDYIVENGASYGMDFKYKYEFKKWYLWAVYSLTYVTRYDGIRHYVPHFDRRHNLNLVGTYTFDKAKTWNLNVRWNFGSGFPFTQTQGFYEKLSANQSVGGNLLTQNGEIGVYYTDINKGRLPTFHRLDASLSKKMNLAKNKSLTVTASVTNVYNRDNIFYVNRSNFTAVYQLPIIPTVGINFAF